MTPRKRGLLVLAVFVTPVIAFFAYEAYEQNKMDEEDRQIMLDRRLNVVEKINRDLEQRAVQLDGDILIVRLQQCTLSSLAEFASLDPVVSRVMNPDNGFREIRCWNNSSSIPVRHR